MHPLWGLACELTIQADSRPLLVLTFSQNSQVIVNALIYLLWNFIPYSSDSNVFLMRNRKSPPAFTWLQMQRSSAKSPSDPARAFGFRRLSEAISTRSESRKEQISRMAQSFTSRIATPWRSGTRSVADTELSFTPVWCTTGCSSGWGRRSWMARRLAPGRLWEPIA